MTISGLDFKNPVGIESFNCFKRVCIIVRNTNESSRSDPIPKEVQNIAVKKITKSTYKVQQQEGDSSGSESEPKIHAMSGPAPKQWNPSPPGLKFPWLTTSKMLVHVRNFFPSLPWINWKKIEKSRMCFSCLCGFYHNLPLSSVLQSCTESFSSKVQG